MSTHAYIVRENHSPQHPQAKYSYIYTHLDGYPEYTGAVLKNFYTTPELVDALIALGDLSFVAPKLEPDEGTAHSFSEPAEHVTVAYGRDRGETDIEAKDTDDLSSIDYYGYIYVFTKECEWKQYLRSSGKLVSIVEAELEN